jgi:hypothetical protein
MRSILERIASLSKRQKIVLGSFLALIVIGSFSNSTDTETSSEVRNPVATSESAAVFPKIEGGYDGILEKILRGFYADNETVSWWERIDKVVEGVIGDETAKMIYIKTDYRLDTVDDVEQATLLCNALISHLPREGLSVRIDGLIRNGRTLLDGTVESKIQEAPVTTFGSSANTDGIPDWCVARTLFYNIVDGLKARGWKQQYGYGSLTPEEKKKMYEGAFMQEGPVYFK